MKRASIIALLTLVASTGSALGAPPAASTTRLAVIHERMRELNFRRESLAGGVTLTAIGGLGLASALSLLRSPELFPPVGIPAGSVSLVTLVVGITLLAAQANLNSALMLQREELEHERALILEPQTPAAAEVRQLVDVHRAIERLDTTRPSLVTPTFTLTAGLAMGAVAISLALIQVTLTLVIPLVTFGVVACAIGAGVLIGNAVRNSQIDRQLALLNAQLSQLAPETTLPLAHF